MILLCVPISIHKFRVVFNIPFLFKWNIIFPRILSLVNIIVWTVLINNFSPSCLEGIGSVLMLSLMIFKILEKVFIVFIISQLCCYSSRSLIHCFLSFLLIKFIRFLSSMVFKLWTIKLFLCGWSKNQLIISFSFDLIAKDFVCFVDHFKSFFIRWVQIRMIFFCHFIVAFLDFFWGCLCRNIKDFVIAFLFDW